jgi:hypothetical protein
VGDLPEIDVNVSSSEDHGIVEIEVTITVRGGKRPSFQIQYDSFATLSQCVNGCIEGEMKRDRISVSWK